MRVALTRAVSPAIAHCELTHLDRQPIDVELAQAQHRAYEAALTEAGCRVEQLAAGAGMPDSVFVEDAAVVLDEIAIIARPGARTRRLETAAVAEALARYRRLHVIEAPGTLDGGDVLVVSRRVFVGCSRRTNKDGISQMRRILAAFGYTVEAVDVTACLHLKSAISTIDDRTLLINPRWIDASRFGEFTLVEVDASEPFAANALRIGEVVVFPREFPRTAERLRSAGVRLDLVAASELAKAEGGVTCCSLLLDVRPMS
jgi:dimethylargininase